LPANGQEYEMQPTANATGNSKLNGTNAVHQQRVSSTDEAPPPPPKDYPSTYGNGYSTGGGLQRSNTTGNSFTQLIKRRFGSLRRRKGNEERAY
jgi:hypothetical protein